ncbi:MAG: D-alanyl-D-alanine carboxypeptidase/D-alanyl-D-alanine-endopeptidase [Chitinivibrionales bacterium]
MRFSNIWIFTAVLFSVTISSEIDTRVLDALKSGGYDPSSAGVSIRILGDTVSGGGVNQDSMFNPASVQKLITGCAALEILGSEYRFKTRVMYDGSFNIDTGVLDGNLYIKGGGDPGFTAERIWLFVQRMLHYGLQEIKGDLIIDNTFFTEKNRGPGYSTGKSSRAYEAPVSPLSSSFNTVAVHVRPGMKEGSIIKIHPFPMASNFVVKNSAGTASSSGVSVSTVKRKKGGTGIYVSGSMSKDSDPRYIYRKIWDPAQNFGSVVEFYLNMNGVKIRGDIKKGKTPSEKVSTYLTFDSKPLYILLEGMYKYSNNFTAEMMLLTLAAEKKGEPGTWKKGSTLLKEWWQDKGFPGTPVIINGSGMGTNSVTPRQITTLLKEMTGNPETFPEHLSALPVAGVNGTLENKFKDSELKGILRGKTGTLAGSGVSNLARYILLDSMTVVFTVFIKSTQKGIHSHRRMHQTILESVYKTLKQ